VTTFLNKEIAHPLAIPLLFRTASHVSSTSHQREVKGLVIDILFEISDPCSSELRLSSLTCVAAHSGWQKER
jgi:hypothetical protein